jgi:hypothetical protein
MPEAPPATTTLYRAVGPQELSRIKLRGWTSFASMPDQSEFVAFSTPEAALARALDIAAAGDDASRIVVLRFAVRASFLAGYDASDAVAPTTVAIPAASVPALNDNIAGEIEIVAEHRNGSTA